MSRAGRPSPGLTAALAAVAIVLAGWGVHAAELEPRTVEAFEHYVADLDARFEQRLTSPDFLWVLEDADRARRVRAGEVVARAAKGDGIIDVPGGLIHHWIAAVWLPGATLDTVLARETDYASYPRIHKPIRRAEYLGRKGDADRVLFRLDQRTRFVHAVLDTWWQRRRGRIGPDRAYVIAKTDLIRQVEHAGTSRERLLEPEHDSGYLWRARTYTRLLERDGGTYIEFQTVGLSRPFPRLLGWLVEPIVRGVGRSSVERTLIEMRDDAVTQRAAAAPPPPSS